MNQLIFKFPFKTNYFLHDFYVSSNNFEAYKLIENYPKWEDKCINIYGPNGCGKTHLSNILNKKINSIFVTSNKFNESILSEIENFDCLIIDDYKNDINEELLYSTINHIKQSDKYIVINTLSPIYTLSIELKDLKSRIKSFIGIGIDLPTDDLLRVIISKSFSEKQIDLDKRNLEYILRNIDRSYDNVLKFIKDIDMVSLSSGKSININLIKKVLNK